MRGRSWNRLNIDWGSIVKNAGIIILQLIIIWIGFLIARGIAKRLISRSFERMRQREKMSEGRAITLERLLLNVISYTLVFVLVVVIFGIFGLPIGGLIAGAGIVGLAIGFGAQGLVSDVVTGFFILAEKWVDVGDVVTTAGLSGVVEEVGLKTTQLRGFDGTLHFIPNRQISTVSNLSRGNMRALVDIGISYDDNIDKAIDVLQEVCDKMAAEDEDGIIVDGPNVIGVQSLGASDVVIRVIGQTKNGEQYGVQRKLLKTIKEAFDENNIDIPFPHQVNIMKKEA
ncbi:MAG TPA: mechanosensitive ion channel family protein [Bacillales bacterium]|nr:mechanosensitive ion channel family protein [Bacillales bacterium]